MSEINKENEEKKKQGRKSEEGIIQIIFWKNIGGNKTAFSNRQLYSSFTLPVRLLQQASFMDLLSHPGLSKKYSWMKRSSGVKWKRASGIQLDD
jgi:hypothetical protein